MQPQQQSKLTEEQPEFAFWDRIEKMGCESCPSLWLFQLLENKTL